jgi:hypothetical protein
MATSFDTDISGFQNLHNLRFVSCLFSKSTCYLSILINPVSEQTANRTFPARLPGEPFCASLTY